MNRSLCCHAGATVLAACLIVSLGCRTHMPHAATWPAGGDIQPTHAKPPEGGYYTDWDPWAVELDVTPARDVNPVQTQHVIIATVKDKDGVPLPNRRVEWMIAEGSVGDIVEVDESGWRASRGYKISNHYAVSHTNNYDHVLTRGNDDPSDDIDIKAGQTWCVITSPIEGDSHVTAYAPGIHDWGKHKVFVTKHWYDVEWEFPTSATNPVGTPHQMTTRVYRHSDGTPLEGYQVTYRIVDGPSATLAPSGGNTATVRTDADGYATITLQQTQRAEGTNTVEIDIVRPADIQCCKPAAEVANGTMTKTWIGPKIAIEKTAPARETVNNTFNYMIRISNPSQVDSTNVVVTDVLPNGIQYVSSEPGAQVSGQSLSWSIGTLPANRAADLNVAVRGTQTGQFENCAEVRTGEGLDDRACAPTVISAPALELDKTCSTEVLLCEPIKYQVVVRNTGDAPATNVRITDNLPEGLTTADGRRTVVFEVGTLAAGAAQRGEITVNAERTGTFSNRIEASADGDLTAVADCRTVVRQPVLDVSKTGPDLRYVGRPFDYALTVRNTGDTPATAVTLRDTFPAELDLVRASDGGQTGSGGITWNLGTLAPGEAKSVSVSAVARRIGRVRNTATAMSNCAQDVTAVHELEIRGIPAILLEVIDVEDPIEVDGTITYLITVTNQGSAVDTNIRISCELPPEQAYVSADGAMPGSAAGRSVTFAPLPSLAPRVKATFRVVARGVQPGDSRFKVKMSSDQTTSSVDETESTRIY